MTNIFITNNSKIWYTTQNIKNNYETSNEIQYLQKDMQVQQKNIHFPHTQDEREKTT